MTTGPTLRAVPAAEPPSVPKRRGRPRLVGRSKEHLDKLEEIIRIGAQVFETTGYEAGSLDDVAEAMGFTRPALYHYISSKEELLHLILDRAINHALANLDEIGKIDDPRERLVAFIRYQVAAIATERSLFKALFDERDALAEHYRRSIKRKEAAYLGELNRWIRSAIEAGVLPDVESRFATHVLLGMTSWTYKWFDADSDDPERVAETCIRMLFREAPAKARAAR